MSDLRKLMQATATVAPKAVKTQKWGTVYVRAITVAEVEAQAADTADKTDKRRIARGAARVICNADGSAVFDPSNADDIELISKQPWPLLKRVIDAADSFNATSEEGVADAKND